ncbi:putative integral membrane protein conserved region (DUF2404) [Novymonas esmeraldas]|uniref:Integral membrane protein conserved region (DUF2404) n=1 Tax=Novymonas esmeraldas TaxID=1808958 RepID=A0AAW0EXB6_9TRYP
MSIYTLLTFLYGALGGAMSCIFFFFVVFRKIEGGLSNTVRKKSRKHADFDAVAKEAAAVAPAKVETLCKMVRFDDGIVGEALQCRMVFYGSTIDVYQVDELRTLADHRQEVVAEHMLARINRNCVVASAQRISKYHRHRNQNTRFAAIKGKCTLLKHKDGMPLFLEDPTAVLKEQLRRTRERQLEAAMMDRLRHRARREGHSVTDEELASEVRSLRATAHHTSYGLHAVMEAHGVSDQHDLEGLDAAAARYSRASQPPASARQRRRNSGHDGRRRSVDGSSGAAEEVPLSEWRCLAVKFPTRRVQERWLNLLQSTPQSGQWHDFITHLPKMDVFNLLVARLFFENSRANTLHDLLEDKLKKKLAGVSKSLPPQLRGNIFLDSLDVGGEIPLISNVSDPTSSNSGDTEFDFDVLYRGGLALKIRFSVLYREIRVPDIIFSIKVLELAGRMRFVVGPPPTRKFWIGGPQPPQLRLEFTQEVASHDGILNAVLKLLPDMSQIASNVVKVMLFEDMVLPNMDDFPWPVLGGDDDDDDDSASATSDAEVVEDEHNISLASLSSPRDGTVNEVGDGGGHRGAAGGRRDAAPQPVITVRSTSSFATTPEAVRNVHFRSATAETLSPPPRPPHPPPSSTAAGSSSLGRLSPPAGLPPRPPRVASADFARTPARVPTSRAPGSMGRRASSEPDLHTPSSLSAASAHSRT